LTEQEAWDVVENYIYDQDVEYVKSKMFKDNVRLVAGPSTKETKEAFQEFLVWRDKRIQRAYIKRIGLHRFVVARVLHFISYRIVWPNYKATSGWRYTLGRRLNTLSIRVTYPDAETYRKVFGHRPPIEGP
jgi:hypothetical protein